MSRICLNNEEEEEEDTWIHFFFFYHYLLMNHLGIEIVLRLKAFGDVSVLLGVFGMSIRFPNT